MIWVTIDLHFNHLNIIKYEAESRPFVSVDDMNNALIHNWNKVVAPEDTVIVCGDFFMGTLEIIDIILPQLKIILVRGNHDTANRLEKLKEHNIEIHDIYYLNYKGRFFIFNHFPIMNEEFVNMVRQDNKEVILCYGHVHHNAPTRLVNGTYHVGVDTNNLTPVNLDYIWQLTI